MRSSMTVFAALVLMPATAAAQEEAQQQPAQVQAQLAKKLANPLASLISVPVVASYDQNIGVDEDGAVWAFKLQPVIPITINEDWNLISRTILTLVHQDDVPAEGAGESGLGDTLESLFFSRTVGGVLVGVGPVFLLPTATDDMLGGEKWGIGPTAVALKQIGPWTMGGLVNHVESVAGDSDRADISATFVQPFLTYIFDKTKTTIAVNTESTYDWESEQWSVPLNLNLLQMLKVGPQILQVGVGPRYWLETPDGGPEGWGGQFKVTFLFPK